MLFGAVNVLGALWTTVLLRESLAPAVRRALQATCVVALALLRLGLWKANAILALAEANPYAGDVVLATPRSQLTVISGTSKVVKNEPGVARRACP